MPKGFTYILRCEGDNLYTGSTQDIHRRFQQHVRGEGAYFTKKNPPIEIAYIELHNRIDRAFYREKQIQRWSRSKKEALIIGDTNQLHELAKCTNETHFSFKVGSSE